MLNILLALAATVKNVPAMRGQISRHIFLPLLFSGLVGTPAGYWLHTAVGDAGLRLGMGLLVLALSAAMLLITPRPRPLTLPALALALAGLASGLLGGAVGIAGPPVVLLFVLTATDMGQARATLALGLLTVCLLAACAYLFGGHITRPVLLLFALALPVVFLGDSLGNRLFARYGGEACAPLERGADLRGGAAEHRARPARALSRCGCRVMPAPNVARRRACTTASSSTMGESAGWAPGSSRTRSNAPAVAEGAAVAHSVR